MEHSSTRRYRVCRVQAVVQAREDRVDQLNSNDLSSLDDNRLKSISDNLSYLSKTGSLTPEQANVARSINDEIEFRVLRNSEANAAVSARGDILGRQQANRNNASRLSGLQDGAGRYHIGWIPYRERRPHVLSLRQGDGCRSW